MLLLYAVLTSRVLMTPPANAAMSFSSMRLTASTFTRTNTRSEPGSVHLEWATSHACGIRWWGAYVCLARRSIRVIPKCSSGDAPSFSFIEILFAPLLPAAICAHSLCTPSSPHQLSSPMSPRSLFSSLRLSQRGVGCGEFSTHVIKTTFMPVESSVLTKI